MPLPSDATYGNTSTFTASDLLRALATVTSRWPDAELGRSRVGTGNINVFNDDGEYVALIELVAGVPLTDFTDASPEQIAEAMRPDDLCPRCSHPWRWHTAQRPEKDLLGSSHDHPGPGRCSWIHATGVNTGHVYCLCSYPTP